jgi:AcrR family transcriptional regulator
LSMRRLAEQINYTPPVIYGYFKNKECLFKEIARRGYLVLGANIQLAGLVHGNAQDRISEMWTAYWNFAISNQYLYRMMYGIDIGCHLAIEGIQEAGRVEELILPAIRDLYEDGTVSIQALQVKFYTYWSVIHGLVSLRILHRNTNEAMEQQILLEAITGITSSIYSADLKD